MWLALQRGQQRRLRVRNLQAVWPASELSDAELVVTLATELEEDVLLATGQVIRVVYRIADIESSFTIDGSPPVVWREASAIKGRSFEIMVTARSAICAPPQGAQLPNRLAGWLAQVAEDVRATWPPLPDGLQAGASWSAAPIVPGGLPPGAASVSVEVGYHAGLVSSDAADVQAKFALSARLEDPALQASAAAGEGSLDVHLERNRGPSVATRASVLTLLRPRSRNQVVRASVELTDQTRRQALTA